MIYKKIAKITKVMGMGMFLLLLTFNLTAQQPIRVNGSVADSERKILAYATVGLYAKKGDGSIGVTYSNDKGVFQLSVIVKRGDYWILISHGGFEDNWINLWLDSTDVQMEEIQLKPIANELQGVTVRSTKRLITIREDGISYNVENDPMAGVEKALDILRKTPMVSVDGEGKVTVNGQSSFKVLVNGRETAMFARNASEALKNYPGSLIKRIDVITNPSAKYDAEGAAGIINIITQKNVIGYNGSINLDANAFSMFNWSENTYAGINGSFNFKKNKTGLIFNFNLGGNHNMLARNLEVISPQVASTFAKRTSDGLLYNNNNSPSANLEWSYEIDSLQALSLYGSVDDGWNGNTNRNNFSVINATYTDTVNSVFTSDNKMANPGWSIGADYIKKFKSSPVKEFSIKTFGIFSGNDTESNSMQLSDDNMNRFILNDSRARDKQYTIQADYAIPVSKTGVIEMGSKTIIRRATSDFQSYRKAMSGDTYALNPTNSNFFTYNQDVYSMYLSYRFSVGKFIFRTGLRMEYTKLEGNFVSVGTFVEQKYTRLLPNILISTRLKGTGQLSFSYSQNLRRPYISSLNPFVNNIDSLNVTTGNPYLQPQLTHVGNIQYRVSKGRFFTTLSMGYSYSNSFVIYGYTFNKLTGVTTASPQNGGVSNLFFFNIGLNVNMSSSFKVNANGTLQYQKMKSPVLGWQQNKGFSGQMSVNSSYMVSPRVTITGFANYYFPVLYLQGQIGGYASYGFGSRYAIIKNKLTGSFFLNNLFNKAGEMKRITTFSDPNFMTERTSYSRFRGYVVSLGWNFGKLSTNVSKKRGVNNSDLL